MYQDIFESIRNEAEKRNLRERTIQLYCSDVSYFLRWIGKPVSALTLEDAESFLTAKRLEGRSPETHNHYRSAIPCMCISYFILILHHFVLLGVNWEHVGRKSSLL